MTENEIREAIEIVKKSHPYATKYKGVKEDEALQTLITLAEEYLKIKISASRKATDALIELISGMEA